MLCVRGTAAGDISNGHGIQQNSAFLKAISCIFGGHRGLLIMYDPFRP